MVDFYEKNNQRRRFVRKEASEFLGDIWDKLSKDGKEKVVDMGVALLRRGINEVEGVLKGIRERIDNFSFLIIGVLLGVLGGLVANVIHSFFTQYKVVYYILVFVLFFGVCIAIVMFVRRKNEMDIKRNRALKLLSEKAEEVLEKKKER